MYSFVTDDTFEEQVIRSPLPVILELFAVWCGPGKQMGPYLEEFKQKNKKYVRVVKVDVMDIVNSSNIIMKYPSVYIPTLYLINEGKTINRHTGAFKNREEIDQWIKRFLFS